MPSKIWIQNGYTKWIQYNHTNGTTLYTKWVQYQYQYVQNVHTKCTFKMYIQNVHTKCTFNVHTFDILVYKMGTKFGQKPTVPSKIWIQNDYTKWIQNDHTKLHHLVYKMGTIKIVICTKCTYKIMYI